MQEKNKCAICGKAGSGIIINGSTICNSCETAIINITPSSELYDYYRKAIGRIFANVPKPKKLYQK